MRIGFCTLLVFTLALAAAPAGAQDTGPAFYGQGILSLPMGDFGDLAKIGFGAGLGVSFAHSEMLHFRGEAGYVYYATEDFPGSDLSFSMIPITALVQYNLENSPLYLLGGLGLAIGMTSVEFDDGTEADDTSSEFGIALGAGTDLTPQLFVEGRFNLISDTNHISAHLGYRF
ncbi:MAG: outer membrane beta-barrel protein [Candidatus Krumholzibacteriia bacterium]